VRPTRRATASEHSGLPALGEALEFMRLIWAVDHGLQRASKRMKAAVGITRRQHLVLHVVGRFPGISVGRLSAALHVHQSTLTGVLARLERRGLLDRRPDPRDGRRAALGLTPAGRRLDVAVPGTVESAVEGVLDDLTEPKVAAAREALTQLARRLGVAIDGSTASGSAPAPRRPARTYRTAVGAGFSVRVTR
jgi:MarR family transcriptional regulator, organic hydroperoxide resistance regulator